MRHISKPSSPSASSSPNVFVGDPALTFVQSTLNVDSAARNQQTGFPPKTRGNDDLVRPGIDELVRPGNDELVRPGNDELVRPGNGGTTGGRL